MPVTRTPNLTVSGMPGPSFFRKVRNFMNNWEVSGGSFSFDGYRARLRVNGGGGDGGDLFKITARTVDGEPKASVGEGYFIFNTSSRASDLNPGRNPRFCCTPGYKPTDPVLTEEELVNFNLGNISGAGSDARDFHTLVEGRNYIYLWVKYNGLLPNTVFPDVVAEDEPKTVETLAGEVLYPYLLGYVDVELNSGVYSYVIKQFISRPFSIHESTFGVGDGLPDGEQGDMLFYDVDDNGTPEDETDDVGGWANLSRPLKPSPSKHGYSIAYDPDNNQPFWEKASGFTIYYKGDMPDGSPTTISFDDAFSGYNPTTHTDWSINFVVSGSALTGTVSYSDDTDIYGFDGSSEQNVYRIPVVRGGELISKGGTYRENIYCAGSDGPIVELVRIG